MLLNLFWLLREIVVRVTFLGVLPAVALALASARYGRIGLRRHVTLLALGYSWIFWVARVDLPAPDHPHIFGVVHGTIHEVVHLGVRRVLNLHLWPLPRVASRLGLLLVFPLILIRKHPKRVLNLIWLQGVVWIAPVYVLVYWLKLLVDFAWLGHSFNTCLLAFAAFRRLLRLYNFACQIKLRPRWLAGNILTFGLSNEVLQKGIDRLGLISLAITASFAPKQATCDFFTLLLHLNLDSFLVFSHWDRWWSHEVDMTRADWLVLLLLRT